MTITAVSSLSFLASGPTVFPLVHWECTRENVIIVSNRIPVSIAGGSPRQLFFKKSRTFQKTADGEHSGSENCVVLVENFRHLSQLPRGPLMGRKN